MDWMIESFFLVPELDQFDGDMFQTSSRSVIVPWLINICSSLHFVSYLST
jgi:hypothetical protein